MRSGPLEDCSLSPAEKNPVLVAAGRRGALKRWGDAPKTVRIDDLSPDQRRLIVALIDAARSNGARKAADDAA